MSKQRTKRVYVGLSGGVDSSVSAALLKRAGFDVVGVFIKVWQPDWMECSAKDDRLDAMRVCAHLDIPFREIDLKSEYKKKVVDYMLKEYRAGRTPNPDVMCNTFVKFGAFYSWAMKNGARYVATGHYARSVQVKSGKLKVKRLDVENHRLFAGSDLQKDQSYFLCQIKKSQLPNIIFPVGNYKKSEIRQMAKKFGLPTAEKKDSQGLCFIGKVDMKDFLSHYIKSRKGKVLDQEGKCIGSHFGAIFYTIGQRHGFTTEVSQTSSSPFYVIAKDISKNTITVSNKKVESRISKKTCIELSDINILDELLVKKGSSCQIRLRYREKLSKCSIVQTGKNNMTVNLGKNRDDIAIGQFAVLYKNDEVLASGIISKLVL